MTPTHPTTQRLPGSLPVLLGPVAELVRIYRAKTLTDRAGFNTQVRLLPGPLTEVVNWLKPRRQEKHHEVITTLPGGNPGVLLGEDSPSVRSANRDHKSLHPLKALAQAVAAVRLSGGAFLEPGTRKERSDE